VLDHMLFVARSAPDHGQPLEVPPQTARLEPGERRVRGRTCGRSLRCVHGTMCTTTTFLSWLPISSPR
jgi:hypothetical protein